MKRKLQIFMSASAATVLALSAMAQETPDSKRDRPDYGRDPLPGARRADRLYGAAKASDLIGMAVKNYQDQKLGKVEDIAVDVESGRIVQVILSTGGFIGIGDTLTAVPPGALHHDATHKVLHLDADKQKLKGAPPFEMSKWSECSDSAHLAYAYRYYGEESAYNFVRDGERNTEAAPKAAERTARDSQSLIPASRLSQVQKASKVMGTPVRNLQNEKLGDVENILVDLATGRIVAMIISSGGFLGMGEELSAVPPTALRFGAERDALQLDANKEQLTSAPHFQASQWPDFCQPTYAQGVYRAYRVEPYFTTDVDNTAQNVRDRKDRTLTPLDQGNSKADLDTTARIRREILAGKDLSVNAKNVKVITSNGRVFLRGPVNSDEERRIIGEIATRIANADSVDNQLEVTRSTTDKN